MTPTETIGSLAGAGCHHQRVSPQLLMKQIQIETAANGYIATETASRHAGMIAADPYVFETFESLSKWLSQQLEKPTTKEGATAKG
jgi:hypothetical protein